MNHNFRKFHRVLALAACAALCFCQACSPYSPLSSETDPSRAQTDCALYSEPPSLPDQKAMEEFELIKQELCQGLASLDYMTQRSCYRDPEAAGLISCYPAFWDISETGWAGRMELIKSLKFQLTSIEKTSLSHDQQFMYDTLSAYADLELALEGMEHFRLRKFLSPESGLMRQIPVMLTSIPFYTRQDIEGYLALLSDLPRLFDDLIQLCRESSDKITFSREWLLDASSACAPYALAPEHNSLALSFSSRLDQIPGLAAGERAEYEARNVNAVAEFVIPAYEKLSRDILELPSDSLKYEGLCGQKNGRLYYSRMVIRRSGTSYANIRQLLSGIEYQLEQNALSLNQLLSQSPDPADGPSTTPVLSGDPEQTLIFLQNETEDYFPSPEGQADALSVHTILPQTEDSYALPGLDTLPFDCAAEGNPAETPSRILRISQRAADDRELLYAALSYTGFPGKFYRENYLKHCPDTPLLSLMSFPGWEKGWDLYGRSYAISYENGLTQKDRQLARLSLSSFMAVRALVDIQVNYYGWSLKEAEDFLLAQYSLQDEGIARALYRNALYSPGDSAVEYAGYLEIRRLKTRMAEVLGDGFTENAFHRFFLDLGPAPFSLIWDKLSDNS